MQNLLPGKFGQAATSASDSMKQQHDPNSGLVLIFKFFFNILKGFPGGFDSLLKHLELLEDLLQCSLPFWVF